DAAGFVIAGVRRLKDLSMKCQFELLNVHRLQPFQGGVCGIISVGYEWHQNKFSPADSDGGPYGDRPNIHIAGTLEVTAHVHLRGWKSRCNIGDSRSKNMPEQNGNNGFAGASHSASLRIKVGFAEQLKGGVIMDVMNVEQARIAEEAGAASVMA